MLYKHLEIKGGCMVDIYLTEITQKYLECIFMYRENNKKWNKISIFGTKEKIYINI